MTAGADGNNGSPVTTDATSPDAKRRGTRPVAALPRLAASAMDAADPSRVHHRPGGEGGASGIPRPTAAGRCGRYLGGGIPGRLLSGWAAAWIGASIAPQEWPNTLSCA